MPTSSTGCVDMSSMLVLTQRGLSLAPKPVLAPAKTLLTLPTLRSDALLALAQPPSAEQASHLLTAHAGLRLEAWLASCTGREHARMGQVRGPCALQVLSRTPECLGRARNRVPPPGQSSEGLFT